MTIAKQPLSPPLAPRHSPPKNTRRWLAKLQLDFNYTDDTTRLSKIKRQGPLSVQKVFYPDGPKCAQVYILHPPAGIVSGDELHVQINTNKNAHALITTPGANRFYKARDNLSIGTSAQKQLTDIRVADDAVVEHLPLETIVYPDAHAINSVDVHLKTNSATYIGWDISCLGLPHCGQPFETGQFSQLNRLFINGHLKYHDRLKLGEAHHKTPALLKEKAGLGGRSVFGSFVIASPEQLSTPSRRGLIIESYRNYVAENQFEKLISVTELDGIIVARYLGDKTEQCKTLFIQLWKIARPKLTGVTGVQPRIWYT